MKASQFSKAQKAFILKQGRDGMPVAEICRKAGISQATYFNWKKNTTGCCRPDAPAGTRGQVAKEACMLASSQAPLLCLYSICYPCSE